MPAILNQEWLNQNSVRNYPFIENLSLIPNEDSSLRLPNSFIVDFVLSIAGNDARIYLATLMRVGTYINFGFSDSNNVTVATIIVNTIGYESYTPILITGTGDYADCRGRLILGDLTEFNSTFNDGAYTFTLANAEFEPCTIRPSVRGVRSITVLNGTEASEKIYGAIQLVSGTNAKLDYDATENKIRISAISGYGTDYNEQCSCTDNLIPPPIRTINGINVEDIEIIGDGKCVQVEKSGNTLSIKDLCSSPCCNCVEGNWLTEQLALIESNTSKLESYAAAMSSKLDQFIQSALLTL